MVIMIHNTRLMSTASNAECECSKANSRVDESAPFPFSRQFQQQPQQPSNANAKMMILVRRELVVRPEHRLGAHDGVPDDAVDVQEETREPPREVAQEALWHWAQAALDVVRQVLVVVFLKRGSAMS